ncbi:hypothetical protein RB531_4376 [Salmonella enterica subsp. enterica serovar Typhimurium]
MAGRHPRSWWKTTVAHQARYGRNLLKMDAFGCTSRVDRRTATGLWVMMTELLETQTVDFTVGAEGLRQYTG